MNISKQRSATRKQPTPSPVGQPARPNFVLLVECQLLAKKQVSAIRAVRDQRLKPAKLSASTASLEERKVWTGSTEENSSIQLSTGALRRSTTAIEFGLKGLSFHDADNFCRAEAGNYQNWSFKSVAVESTWGTRGTDRTDGMKA